MKLSHRSDLVPDPAVKFTVLNFSDLSNTSLQTAMCAA